MMYDHAHSVKLSVGQVGLGGGVEGVYGSVLPGGIG